MTTADWAFVISLSSMAIAIATFVWSVWSHFIFPKPRVETRISVMRSFQAEEGWGAPCVTLNATNHGPAEVTLHLAFARSAKRWFQKRREAMLNPYNAYPYDLDSAGPFSGGLPKKLAVGEQFSAYFPLVKEWFEQENFVDFGFTDTFGRVHWCPRKQVKSVRKKVLWGNEQEGPSALNF